MPLYIFCEIFPGVVGVPDVGGVGGNGGAAGGGGDDAWISILLDLLNFGNSNSMKSHVIYLQQTPKPAAQFPSELPPLLVHSELV